MENNGNNIAEPERATPTSRNGPDIFMCSSLMALLLPLPLSWQMATRLFDSLAVLLLLRNITAQAVLLLSVASPAAYVRSTPYYMQHSPSPPFSASADTRCGRHKSNGVHIYTKRNRVSNWFVCPQLPHWLMRLPGWMWLTTDDTKRNTKIHSSWIGVKRVRMYVNKK